MKIALAKIKSDERVRFYIAGGVDVLPILISSFPFGIIVGAATYGSGFSFIQATGFSLIVYAGAAQLAVLELMGDAAPFWMAIIAGIVINMRFLLYSASLSIFFRSLSFAIRLPMGYTSSDQAYGVFSMRLAQRQGKEEQKKRIGKAKNLIFAKQPLQLQAIFYLGASTVFYMAWQIAFFIGYFSGGMLLKDISLDFVVPLTYLTMLLGVLKDGNKRMWTVALISGIASLAAYRMPLSTGFLVAVVVGLLLAYFFTAKIKNLEDLDEDMPFPKETIDRGKTNPDNSKIQIGRVQ